MTTQKIAEDLAMYFLVHDYKWKLDIGLVNPDEDDIRKTIEKATQMLEDKEDHSQLEVGRLIFKKNAGVIDIFVYAGTIGEENEDSNV